MNKLVFITFCITFSFIKTDPINWIKTEPYETFDWLKDDTKTQTIITSGTAYTSCALFNTTHICIGECKTPKTNTLTCTYKGGDCGADPDNPTFKYYYTTYCSTSKHEGKSGKSTTVPSGDDVGVTVALCNSHFIKYSMVLLLSLLVL